MTDRDPRSSRFDAASGVNSGAVEGISEENDDRMTTVDKAEQTSAVAEQHECQLQDIIDHARDDDARIYCDGVLPFGRKAGGQLDYERAFPPLPDGLNGVLGHRTVDFFGREGWEIDATIKVRRDRSVDYTPGGLVGILDNETGEVNYVPETVWYTFDTTCLANVLTGEFVHATQEGQVPVRLELRFQR